MNDEPSAGRNAPPPEFYVPYLPVGPRQKVLLRVVVVVMLWVMAGVSGVVALSQSNPGKGVWEDGVAKSFTGTIYSRPYPMVYAADRGDGTPGVIVLVEVGKHGAGGRVFPGEGTAVTVSGWPLHRDGRWMLELEPGAGSITPLTNRSMPPRPDSTSLGRVTLRGEIVDSKCFLGAMKPGEGKTHKECATLCISGGIPPTLVTRDARGTPTFYLLLDPKGGPLSPDLYPFIADAVEITGDLEEVGQSMWLRVDVDGVKRL